MDFVSVILFAIMLYVRPQEIFEFLSAFRPVFVVMAFAIAATFFRRPGFHFRDLLRTPHDWLMLLYFLHILFLAPGPIGEVWTKIYPFIGFYFVIVLALSNMTRLNNYLGWWCACVMFIAIMALLSLVGFDPVGSAYATEASRGRLAFNTSLFDNPNALGHSVMVAIPLLYFLLFWKRPVFVKELAGLLIFLVLLCMFYTESKGAFLAGFAAVLATLAFGRPKAVQLTILLIAGTIGVATFELLPRFEQFAVGRGRQDEAIVGRLEAFEFGQKAMENNRFGIGYDTFYQAFGRQVGLERARASHSSYNQVGSELGYWGLLLFTGILYACYHTLIRAKTTTDEQERIRRALFCLLISYTVSSWLIDFAFRAAFFVMVAMIGAFHRLLQAEKGEAPATETALANAGAFVGRVARMASGSMAAVRSGAAGAAVLAGPANYLAQRRAIRGQRTAPAKPFTPARSTSPTAEATVTPGAAAAAGISPLMPWARLGVIDVVLIFLLTQGVIYIRDWAIQNL